MANFKGVTERHAAHIMLSSLADEQAREKLAALREKSLAGADFPLRWRARIPQDVGSANSGGDLGFSAGDAFPAEFEEASLGLEPGGFPNRFRPTPAGILSNCSRCASRRHRVLTRCGGLSRKICNARRQNRCLWSAARNLPT